MREDRRIKYTKMVLKESLLELMEEKPLLKITTSEICRKADVNRNTFYNHFTDAQDLLAYIEKELYDEVMESVSRPVHIDTVITLITDICESIMSNAAIYKVLISPNGDSNFLKKILFIAHDKSMHLWRQVAPAMKSEESSRLYAYFANGSIAVIQEWVLNDCKQSPSEIAYFLDTVSSRGLRAFLQKK